MPHFAVSLRISAVNCSGVEGAGSAPEAMSLLRTDSSCSDRITAAFRLSTVAFGVLPGTTTAYQLFDSTPSMPCSASVFTSGSSG